MRLRRGKNTGLRSRAFFEIDSSGVAVSIVVETSEHVDVVWHTRNEFAFMRGTDFVRYERSMYTALLEVGMKFVEEGMRVAHQNPHFSARTLEVVCVLSSPWVYGTVYTIQHSTDKPFIVTQALLDEMHAGAVDAIREQVEYLSWSEVVGSPELTEQYNLSVALDGYVVQNFLGRQVQSIVLQTYFSFMAQSVAKNVQHTLARTVPNHSIRLIGVHMPLYRAALQVHHPLSNFVMIDVEGQITTVCLIRDGLLSAIGVVPYGTYDMLIAVAPQAKRSLDARQTFDLWCKQHDQNSENADLSSAFMHWTTSVFSVCARLAHGVRLPRTVLLRAPDNLYDRYVRSSVKYLHDRESAEEIVFSGFEIEPLRYVEESTTKQGLGKQVDERTQSFARHC